MINKLAKKNNKIISKNKIIEKIKNGKISKKNAAKTLKALAKQKNIKIITNKTNEEKNSGSDDGDSEMIDNSAEMSDAQEEDVNSVNEIEMNSSDENNEEVDSDDEEDDEKQDCEEQDDEKQDCEEHAGDKKKDNDDEGNLIQKKNKDEDQKIENRKLLVKFFADNVQEHHIRKLFAPFGTIRNVFFYCKNRCFVVMSTEEEALAATSLNRTNLNEKLLLVEEPLPFYTQTFNTMKTEDKTIYVTFFSVKAPKDELKEKFSECGEIEFIHMMPPKSSLRGAVIKYKVVESLEKALQLNKTMWKDGFLSVRKFERKAEISNARNERELNEQSENGCRIFIENMDDSISIKQIKEVFSSCGPISSVRIHAEKYNKQNSYVTFKDAKSCRKAMNFYKNLKGTDLIVSTAFNSEKAVSKAFKSEKTKNNKEQKHNIIISHIPKDCNIAKLESFFSSVGKVGNINLNEEEQKALITFIDTRKPKNHFLNIVRKFLALNKLDDCALSV